MCGGSAPTPPPARDFEAEERAAKVKATNSANKSLAQRNRARRKSSVLTNVGGGAGVSNSRTARTTGNSLLSSVAADPLGG